MDGGCSDELHNSWNSILKLLVMKMYRCRRDDSGMDLARVAAAVSSQYQRQRFFDPSKDDSQHYEIIRVQHQSGHDNCSYGTKLLEFFDSDIRIAERLVDISGIDDFCMESVHKLARDHESQLESLLTEYPGKLKALWSVFWLVPEPDECQNYAALITDWLANTQRPNDAEAIIAGKLDCSMSWLRYVVVNNQNLELNFDAMRMAQYYYCEFDQLNSDLFELMLDLSKNRTNKVGLAEISRMKTATDVQRVRLQEFLKTLPRAKKKLVEQILGDWDFERLQSSVGDLRFICSDIIQNKRERKTAISQVVTEVILVAIGLCSFLSLILTWAFASRQLATSPTLLVEEIEVPWIAKVFALMPLDYVALFALVFMFGIMVVYAIFKSRFR